MASTVPVRLRQSLRARVLTAALGIPLLLGVLWLGRLWWLVLLAVLVSLAAHEFAGLVALAPRAEGVVRAAGLGIVLLAAAAPWDPRVWIAPVWVLALAALGLAPILRAAAPSAAGAVLLGAVYLGVPAGLLARWRIEPGPAGFSLVLAFLLTIWINDIAAYFVGIAAGRHKMAPRVSPGKSWEGAIAGLGAGVLVAGAVAPWLGLPRAAALLWGAAAVVAAQAGDLFESALKRRAGVKDSGGLLPGHGGVLDRFDGILVAAPVGYLLWRVFQP